MRDKNDFSLWAKTIFDEDSTAQFGTKIIWLSRIMKHHIDLKNEIDNDTRIKIQQKINEIREIRMILHITLHTTKRLNLKMLKIGS